MTAGDPSLSFFSIFGMLKVIRVFRLNKLITKLNVSEDRKMTMKLAKLIFFIILYIHCVGCSWWYLVDVDQIWIPPLDFMYIRTDLFEEDTLFQYVSSFYHAVLMLNGNELGPRNQN